MIAETGRRFEVWLNGRCYGRYRVLSRAQQREAQVAVSQGQPKSKPKAGAA